MSNSRSIYIGAMILTVPLALAIGLYLGHQQRSSYPTSTPYLSLHVTYSDNTSLDDTSMFNGHQGGNSELHQGTANYVFKNHLPFPIKIIFPPIGYTFGGMVQITPQVTNLEAMPSFCQKKQIVQIEPGREVQFDSRYAILCPANQSNPSAVSNFVFGCLGAEGEKDVFVGEVTSTSEMRSTQEKDQKKSE